MSTDPTNTATTIQPACIVKDIQFFANPAFQNHKASVNKYRTRFEEEELKFIYWDIELVNLLYKKQSSSVTFRLRCKALTTGKEMYAEEQTVNFTYADILKTTTNSFGSETGGYWKADQYLWDLSVNGNMQLSKTIIIDKMGMVTQDNNPYFDVLETKLFPGYINKSENTQGYRYLTQFNRSETEYVGIELFLKRKFKDSKNLEFIVTIIDAASGLVYALHCFDTAYQADSQPSTVYTRFHYGGAKNSFWVNGTYLFYVSFMNVTIAAGQFSVGDEEIAGALPPLNKATLNIATKTNAEKQEASVETALAQLDELTGMAGVKKAIRENIEYLRFNKLRMEKGFADDSGSNLHSIFTGNPGTGKTTVVRLLGKIYKAMGVLSKGHVVEATRADLIGEYIGQTAPKTKAMIEKARGGILFIDEVYSLARESSKNDFGTEAIEMLLVEMSSGAGDIAIIGAGYPAEVELFLNSNPGLKSRFGRYFNFEDYMPDELMQIADRALKIEEATLSTDAKIELEKKFTDLYRSREKYFGNGRLAFSIIDEAKKHMGIRLMKLDNLNTLSAEDLSRIEIEDLRKVFAEDDSKKLHLTVNEKELNEALQELDRMVGLPSIKQEIKDKINLVRFYSETGKEALNNFSLHALLTGNPGTGKTTLARLLGKIYKALGLLERGHVVEVDRQNLVAGYVGQTALKTAAAINNAMGGILFIDEAYSLTGSGDNDFGSEAIETLLKMMEDHRGKFSVIAAGYTDNMNEFVRSNPGLQSRFDAAYNLPDYTSEELLLIAQKLLALQELTLQAEALHYLSGYLNQAYENRDKYFGNARFVRQTVETIVTRQNLRMAALPSEKRTPEMLKQVLLADVEQLQIKESPKRQTIGFNTH
ncbi:MAG: AAA family ATPase [Bacteroidetes bacterium]|nr:AAA family ATPase [Bacteroidota bacterium]